MDMWRRYAKLVGDQVVNAQILFGRFHIVKHLNEAVDEAHRVLWRQLTSKELPDHLETPRFARMRMAVKY